MIFLNDKLHIQTDDRLKIGDKPLKHTNPKGQEIHDEIMKDKKNFLKQFEIKA